MPFTSQELTNAGFAALDFHIQNNPIDQVDIERPFLQKLMKGKKPFPGGKQYITERLRFRYQSNFQWTYGDAQVSYNKRQSLKQVQYPWRGWHDGYSLNEDELLQNGITIVEGKGGRNSGSERLLLTDLLTEQNEILRLGAEEKFDQELLQDGTQDADSLVGLDGIVKIANEDSGTTGGIDRATNTWWRNNVKTSLSTSAGANYIIDNMEIQWRKCSKNGGKPDYIMAGSDFIESFRTAAKAEISRYTILSTSGQAPMLDPSTGTGNGDQVCDTGLHFHGVPIMWNPVFEDLDALLSPTIAFEKRCYFLNCRTLKLRPAQGHDMITRKPPRVYDRYAYYWGLTWKGALCCNRLNANSVMSIA